MDTVDLPVGLTDNDRINDFERKRCTFRDDPYRPRYHFVPPGGTLHDPNGACYWNGRYHLFYQFWPPTLTGDRPWNEAMHWGHAVSEDLLYWRDLPVALAPDPGPERSCYSGQALVEDGRVVLMYHGPGAGNCIATASDEFLVDIEKHPDNPVIPQEDAEYDVFDPCIWKEADTYYSLSGGEVEGRTAEFLFRSTNLVDWEYLGPLVDDGHHTDPGEDGAVPNFFQVGGKHVLLFFSHSRGPQYYVGEYGGAGSTFEIDGHGRMNFGPVAHSNLHAPSVLTDDDGRRIAFFNVREGLDGRRKRPWEGWTEVMSLPRVLTVESERLVSEPIPELAALRADHRRIDGRDIPSNGELVVDGAAGASIELAATVAVEDAEEVGITVLRSPDGAEKTVVSYWDRVNALGIDTSRSTERTDVLGRTPEIGPLDLGDDERLRLRVFVDRSIVEVFANGRQCLTTRVYPDRPDSTGVGLFARRGSARLESMELWEMQDIWG